MEFAPKPNHPIVERKKINVYVEIDIETLDKDGKKEFKVTHNSFVDNASSAYDFSKALKELKMWSDNNPGHIPVYIIIEPKR